MFRGTLIAVFVVAAAAVTAAADEPAPPAAPALAANRIILRVTDLPKSVAFYRDQVGLPLQSTFDEFAVLGGNGTTVMLQQVARKSSGPGTGLASLTEVVLESADVFASYQVLKSRGVVFRREPAAATTDGTKVLYAADFRDPDGHIVSITGWVSQRDDASERTASQSQSDGAPFDITPHHTGISVPNLEESVAWYRRMLGFEVVRRVSPNPNIAIALLRRNGCYLELFQVAGAAPLPESRRSPTADLAVHGIKHFAFEVADARSAAAALKNRGAEIVMGPVENTTEIFFFVRDNSGNAFELIQYKVR